MDTNMPLSEELQEKIRVLRNLLGDDTSEGGGSGFPSVLKDVPAKTTDHTECLIASDAQTLRGS